VKLNIFPKSQKLQTTHEIIFILGLSDRIKLVLRSFCGFFIYNCRKRPWERDLWNFG